MKLKLIMMCAVLCAFGLVGCSNTFEGMGRDMESAGEWMQGTAN